jgi:hypothetical protein
MALQPPVTAHARAPAPAPARTRARARARTRSALFGARNAAALALLALSCMPGRAHAGDGGVDAGAAGPAPDSAPAPESAPAQADGGAAHAADAGATGAEAPVYPPGYVPSEQAAQDLGEYPPPSVYAVPPLPNHTGTLEGLPGAREHDGFFLRLSMGPGAGRARYDESLDGVRVSEVEANGLSGLLDVAVGGRLVGNLILHGNLIFSRFNSPTRRVDSVEDASISVSTSATLVGAGVSYYFMPLNVYLSTTLGLGWLFERRSGEELRSGTGFSMAVAAGKEWWVGRSGSWGVGAGLHGTFVTAPVDIAGVESKMKAGNIAAVFSATYN